MEANTESAESGTFSRRRVLGVGGGVLATVATGAGSAAASPPEHAQNDGAGKSDEEHGKGKGRGREKDDGDDGDDGDDSEEPGESDKEVVVTVQDTDEYGEVLADENGYTLYPFAPDDLGDAYCTVDNRQNRNSEVLAELPCTSASATPGGDPEDGKWPLVLAEEGAGDNDVTASEEVDESVDVGTADRDDPDGTQVTVEGMYVYNNVQDAAPGDARGPKYDSGGEWYVIDTDGDLIEIPE